MRETSRGFTLLEALIAVVILSVGLLGVAAMQLKSLQFSQNSYQRSVAISQANDAVERLWAGICRLPGGLGDIEEDWQEVHEGSTPGMSNWTGSIIADTDAEPVNYTINISWQDERIANAAGNAETTSFTYTTVLPQLTSCPQP